MGVLGWTELQDDVTLVGVATHDDYSGHDNVFNREADWDWSLFVQPAAGSENLATNRAGVRNKGGAVECEIQPPDGFRGLPIMHSFFDPLLNHTVTVVGTWVEDISHNNKTEIHPITSVLDESADGAGLVPATEKTVRFLVFCDTSTPSIENPIRPHTPPHANQLRMARMRVGFPPTLGGDASDVLDAGNVPAFNVLEENDHSLNKRFAITQRGDTAFLEGEVQVDQGHAFYFARIHLAFRQPAGQHAFARNGNGELIHYYWSPQPGWAAENLTRYANVGAAFQIAGDPEVVNLQSGDVPTQHVFAFNGNGELVHYYWSPQPGWAAENLTQYPNIGAAFRAAGGPGVVNMQSGDTPTQHAFARNGNGELVHYYWSPQPGWAAENLTQYANIGAAFRIAGDPEVVNLQSGDVPTQHVLARNGNGDLIHYYWSPQPGWAAENLTQYANIGAAFRIAGDPEVVTVQSGDVPGQHAFARNANGDLIHYYWSPQPGWAAENLTQYANIGAAFRIAGDPEVVNLQSGNVPTQHVFTRNANGELVHYFWSPQAGWAAENLTQYANIGAAFRIAGDPQVVNLQSGDVPTQHAFGRNRNGDVIHYYWSPQPGWAAENLTQYPNIGAAFRTVTDPEVINLQSGNVPMQHAFGRNADGELVHYYWSAQPGWVAENLTQYGNIGAAFKIAGDPEAVNL